MKIELENLIRIKRWVMIKYSRPIILIEWKNFVATLDKFSEAGICRYLSK